MDEKRVPLRASALRHRPALQRLTTDPRLIRRVVYGHFTDQRDSLLMGFSDEEIKADRAARATSEADRDNRRRSSLHIGPTETCLHCHRPFPVHEATSIDYPICPTCLD